MANKSMTEEQLAEAQATLQADQEQLAKDQAFVEKLKTVAVKTPSRTNKFPATVSVCGNVLPVDEHTGKVIGESDPRKIRRRRLQLARQRREAGLVPGESMREDLLPQGGE